MTSAENVQIPDPYEGPPNMTDCDIWSDDVVKILINPFMYKNKADNEVTEKEILQSERDLLSALIYFYQTHL